MNKDVKELYEKALAYYEKVGNRPEFDGLLEGMTVKELLRLEVARFLMYLSASDGQILQEEVEFVSEYLGEVEEELTPESVNELIKENNIYSREFENTAPMILRFTVMADNKAYEAGEFADSMPSEMLVDMFKSIGQDFIACDGDVDEQELADWETYMKTLNNYIKTHLHKFQDGNRSDGAVVAPAKA